MYKAAYIQEAERKFSNTEFYKFLTEDPIAQYQEELDTLLKKLPLETEERINASIY